MIMLEFNKANPPVRFRLPTHRALRVATELVAKAESKDAFPVGLCADAVAAPVYVLRTPAEACALAVLILGALKVMGDEAAAEARRIAGASPVAEDMELVSGPDGLPVAAKKTFRY